MAWCTLYIVNLFSFLTAMAYEIAMSQVSRDGRRNIQNAFSDTWLETYAKRHPHSTPWYLLCLYLELSSNKNFQGPFNSFIACDAKTIITKTENEYFDSLNDSDPLTHSTHPEPLDSVDRILPPDAEEGGLICPNCTSRKTVYRLVATRRADEGMTSICNCTSCGHNWKMSA